MLHPALRAPRDAVIEDGGKNVVPEVWAVLDKIKAFTGELGQTGGGGVDVVVGGEMLAAGCVPGHKQGSQQ